VETGESRESAGNRPRQRVTGVEIALCRLRNRHGAGEPGIERVWEGLGVEAKKQVGSVDLAMVAKASLRASERPFRVSGSGRMRSVEGSLAAVFGVR